MKAQKNLAESWWVALRLLEERKNLLTSIAGHGSEPQAAYQTERAEELRRHLDRLREFLLNGSEGTGIATNAA